MSKTETMQTMTLLEREHPVNNTVKEPLGAPVAKASYESGLAIVGAIDSLHTHAELDSKPRPIHSLRPFSGPS